MSVRATRTFQVSFAVTVSVHEIDDNLATATKKRWNNESLAHHPAVIDQIARERRLLAALAQRPDVLRREALRQIAWELDPIRPTDQLLAEFGVVGDSDRELVDQLQEVLPSHDVARLRALTDAGVFYDNTSFYQEAFTTTLGAFSISDHMERRDDLDETTDSSSDGSGGGGPEEQP